MVCHDWTLLTMIYFHIETNFVTKWRWTTVHHDWTWSTMVDCDWFSYWHNLCHNVIGPWLTFISTMIDHGWPWLTIFDHGWTWLFNIETIPINKPKRLVILIFINVGLTMIDFHIESIFLTMWCWTMVDHCWFPYWDNICHNVTVDHGWPWFTMVDDGWQWFSMVHFHIETMFAIMWRWNMVDHDYKPKG